MNCGKDSRWLNENLSEFACALCYCKMEQKVDGEFDELNLPELRNMFEPLPNGVLNEAT